ncbi:tRNA lysidine(34) synthetase TilS [Dyadobacter flavalbus]|uniref:tRNA(Ile)-lysidine synthase n=1 Tax=Dyadobacter flavalbus TaxID=2579942 RepID=A0A5M8QQW1_9BACT|nr:tRNA lysidine(34) synthetase TilS [Dyadobacter flavalbus]KAA6438575.1 tRNA lysidine(34) synthetase TilS [Dyadobacter flavalbus]
MLDSFLTFINQQGLDLRDQSCLLAVSGGVDSVVMTHLFYKMGYAAVVAHCNFSLRGAESDGDETFVNQLAEAYGFAFVSKKFDTRLFAGEQSVSTQMAARELRYSWFEEVRKSYNLEWIATAHHINDSLETSLLNLVRGTGISGLYGISSRNNFVIRPLLFASREEIMNYAAAHDLKWREDRSNDSDDYKRNLIRHKVIPVFREMNPSLESTFVSSSERLKAADNLLRVYLEDWKKEVLHIENELVRIPISKIISANEPIYRLWSILQDFGFTYSQVRQIGNNLSGISGRLFSSSTHSLLMDRSELILKPKQGAEDVNNIYVTEPDTNIVLPYYSLTFSKVLDVDELVISKEKHTAYIDAVKLIFPLTIRKWKTGDYFMPFGMKGKKKKISDLLVDLKFDLFQKENIYILENRNGEIIWVVGVRSDERFRIQDYTRQVIIISQNQK